MNNFTEIFHSVIMIKKKYIKTIDIILKLIFWLVSILSQRKIIISILIFTKILNIIFQQKLLLLVCLFLIDIKSLKLIHKIFNI